MLGLHLIKKYISVEPQSFGNFQIFISDRLFILMLLPLYLLLFRTTPFLYSTDQMETVSSTPLQQSQLFSNMQYFIYIYVCMHSCMYVYMYV